MTFVGSAVPWLQVNKFYVPWWPYTRKRHLREINFQGFRCSRFRRAWDPSKCSQYIFHELIVTDNGWKEFMVDKAPPLRDRIIRLIKEIELCFVQIR